MSIFDRYCIGGLEPCDSKTLTIDDTKYTTNKFKAALRNTIIDWGTFLEVYNDSHSLCQMFDQAVRLLDLKDNEHLRKDILLTLKSLYELPDEAHLTCMLKQYVAHETLSIIIYNIFILIKLHYEKVVIKFLEVRNKTKPKNPNDIDALLKTWADIDQQYDIDSSSIILLFLNPKLKSSNVKLSNSKIHYKTKNVKTDRLTAAVKKFHYKGFCKRVPKERLDALLAFPINEFMTAIHDIESVLKIEKTEFPDYTLLEKKMADILKDVVDKPSMPKQQLIRDQPSSNLTSMEKARFYISKTLEIRKQLLPYGLQFEEYYSKLAEKLVVVYEMLKTVL